MEKIIPRTSENKVTKAGVPFWAVESMGGGKYTIWDKSIADQWEANFGKEIDVDVHQSGKYLNIRGIGGIATPNVISSPKITPIPTSRENSIIAQCLTKAAISTMPEPVTINYVVDMYKLCLKLLDK